MAKALTVMTYNIRKGRDLQDVLDLDRAAAVIRAQQPDVVALQEVGRHWDATTEFKDQAAELGRLTGMASAYGANLDRDPLERGAPRRQYGTAILSAWPLRVSRNILLPRPGPEVEQRGVLVADIDLDGEPFRMFNAHLGISPEERRLQVRAILDEAESATMPHALFGDLNAPPNAPEVAPLLERFADAWAIGGAGDGFTFPAAKPTARIDYVLVSAHFQVGQVTVPTLPGSDHLSLVAELTLT